MNKFKIWHISDTHTYHYLLNVPKNIEIVIHSGDATNNRNASLNHPEMLNFIEWFSSLDIPYKIYVAGNHDSSIENKMFTKKSFKDAGIIYLENESIVIHNLLFYGSPFTPTFNNWCFMKPRDQIYKIWSNIPSNVDILITHGPPKGILDLTENRNHLFEFCGCKNLRNEIKKFENMKLMCFGHIHNYKDIINSGIKIINEHKSIFSNASVVEDGGFGFLISNGNIFTCETINDIKYIKYEYF